MASAHPYRIESRSPLNGSLLPPSSMKQTYADYSLAVAVAVKSVSDPETQEVRVVYEPTGEIVFQTHPA
jgi:quercetin dioxygenase-like cupin family protein